MIAELAEYQSTPTDETLTKFWLAVQDRASGIVESVLARMGRTHDRALADVMLSEASYRIMRAAKRRLLALRLDEKKLKAYIDKLLKGAAIDAADTPTCGPTRRNARRWKEPGEPLRRHGWYRPKGGSVEMFGSRGTYRHTSHDGRREQAAPDWALDQDHGADIIRFSRWVARTAKKVATLEELVAINQVLAGRSDRETAMAMKIPRTTWTDRRARLLAGLAPRIIAAADWQMDELGEKLLGILWTHPSNEAWADVLLGGGMPAA